MPFVTRKSRWTPLIAALAGATATFFYQAAAQTIEQGTLTQLNGWSVGALSSGQGALPATLWQGSTPASLGALFDRLPASFESPAARRLARRALSSGGAGPEGDAALEAVRKRFSALGRLGFADDLAVMAAGAGTDSSDPAITQYAAQAELARGRRGEACARGRAASGDEPSSFHLRLRAYCAAASGERAAADLAMALITGRSPDDLWFRSAIAGVGEGAPRPTVAARYDNSLNASLSLATQLRPSAAPLAGASNLALATLARSDAAQPALRSQAAAMALRRGVIDASEARRIFAAIPADTPPAGLPLIALAVRAAEAGSGGAEAAVAIAAALRGATSYAEFAGVAQTLRADIANLLSAPTPDAALSYARAALAADDVRLAQRLIASVANSSANQIAVVRLQTALGAAQNRLTEMDIQRRLDQGGPTGARLASRDLTILAALGAPIGADARTFVTANAPTGGRVADAGLLTTLAAAAEHQSLAETALIAAVLTAPGVQNMSADSLAAIIRGLRAAGLEDAARDLAVEALLGAAPA